MGAIRRAIDSALGYTFPVASGLAAIVYALPVIGTDRLSRWLRTNTDHEPEPAA
jgi:hypothetical protein